jgi:protein TonB
MLISKFDLYKTEWLDLVFDHRNKNYGAYELRQSYAGTVVRAMGITFTGLTVLIGLSFFLKGKNVESSTFHDKGLVVVIDPHIKLPVDPIKKNVVPLKPLKQKTLPPVVATLKNLPPVAAPDQISQKPVETAKLATATISNETVQGKPGNDNALPSTSDGNGSQPAVDESIHPNFDLDVMPEPVGGEKAWSKFLNKNLRFPDAAQDEKVSGKVFISFIIEKDGSLSNLTVDKAAGHGFDEEALRVLKLAKAWKPGMQNGQPVRVRYTIPINFQLSE